LHAFTAVIATTCVISQMTERFGKENIAQARNLAKAAVQSSLPQTRRGVQVLVLASSPLAIAQETSSLCGSLGNLIL